MVLEQLVIKLIVFVEAVSTDYVYIKLTWKRNFWSKS